MDLRLSGKTALVTGSGQGIGLAIAHVLHQEGCNVALNARRVEGINATANQWRERVSTHAADVTQQLACRDLVKGVIERWGRLDILVCNVGSGASVPPGQEDPDEWQRLMDLNFFATTNMLEAARERLKLRRGVVLCISSICGAEILGAPVTYSAAKAALNQYVRGMSRPLAQDGMRINAIAPGNILTENGTWEHKLRQDPEGVQRMLHREVALQRLGQPHEIADFAAFLVSPRAAFATGSVFTVDGGQVRS